MLVSEQLNELVKLCIAIIDDDKLSVKECQYVLYRKLLKLGYVKESRKYEMRNTDDE